MSIARSNTFICCAAAVVVSVSTAAPARAEVDCRELWLERNGIYAANGYCFKTQNAIDYFGKGCFPPYGRLSKSEQRRVDRIRRKERLNGCSGSWSLPG